jgi:hypothetical protein
MKKTLYVIGLSLLIASCSDSYSDWATPKSSAQEDAKTVALTTSEAAAIDYASLTSDSVQLFIPSVAVSDAATTLSYNAIVYNSDKSKSTTLVTDANGYQKASDLKTAVENLYGKRPDQRTLAMDVTGFTRINGESVITTSTATAKVTLKAPFIDSDYYLVGDFAGWNKESALHFTHIGSGDVYDNPEFYTIFKTTAANQYWKVIPATNYNGDFWSEGTTGVVGVVTDGDTSLSGNLVTTSPKAGKLETPSIYRMTINMMDYSYKFEALNFNEFVYEIGNESGWKTSHPLYGEKFDGAYQGCYYLNGEFKFKPNADNWDGDWGKGSADGILVQEGESNVSLPDGEGMYLINVDIANMTYGITKMNKISIIRTVNGNWDTDTDLTYNTETGAWETTATLNAGSMKFRMNHDWTISWGGANGDATNFGSLTNNNGKDLSVAAGKYKIQLYLTYNGNSKVVMTVQ